MITTDAQQRKDIPVYSGFVCYFPDAMIEVAKLSKAGNDQHNPGSKLHWDRTKSGDELDALMRHLIDNSRDGSIKHLRAVAWRAMAQLQKACEGENSKSQKIADPNYACGITKSPADRRDAIIAAERAGGRTARVGKVPTDHIMDPAEVTEHINRLNTDYDADIDASKGYPGDKQ